MDLEKNILSTEEDALIQKVLTEKKGKRKRSDEDEAEADDGNATIITTDANPQSSNGEEHDMKWAANYIEEQQTQLILSLLNDAPDKSLIINDEDDSDGPDEEKEQNDYKSLRPTLQTMGIGK